jgi:hypothetical protein
VLSVLLVFAIIFFGGLALRKVENALISGKASKAIESPKEDVNRPENCSLWDVHAFEQRMIDAGIEVEQDTCDNTHCRGRKPIQFAIEQKAKSEEVAKKMLDQKKYGSQVKFMGRKVARPKDVPSEAVASFGAQTSNHQMGDIRVEVTWSWFEDGTLYEYYDTLRIIDESYIDDYSYDFRDVVSYDYTGGYRNYIKGRLQIGLDRYRPNC